MNETQVSPPTVTLVPPTPLQASIIIVAYNAQAYLEKCLSSVLETSGARCEVILVDNASSDGSAEVAAQKFPHIRVIRNENNLGFGQGNNLGAQGATGQYLVFLNPDTLVEPGWLEALITALEDNPRAGLVTSKILLLNDPERINTCGNAIHLTGLTVCRGLRQSKDTFNQRESVAAVSGAAFAIRRELFEQLGGFDEDFFLYMEDTDLSWRARLAGWDCLYVPESMVLHDYTLRITPLKVFYQERNRYLMLLKSLRWPTLLILSPALLLAEVVTWGFVMRSDREHLGNKWRAYEWIVKHWHIIQSRRRAVQALRRAPDRALLRRTGYRLDFEQAGQGLITSLAHLVFDPLFLLLRQLAFALVWW
jgi:GT2 family glycosyltransferase